MSPIDRRTFLKVVASIPLAVWLEQDAIAEERSLVFVRHNVNSTKGQAMLKIYADGVSKMRALPDSDPRSWTFQWYTHAVHSDSNKTNELSRIYPAVGPQRDLADNVWNTCRAHFDSNDEPYFLPWHRMYLLRFERIIRKLTNHPEFTLPYWNYSAPTQRILPGAFRDTGSPLFVSNRNAWANAGQPIRSDLATFAQNALSKCSYNNPRGADDGFCQNLDFVLHAFVHSEIGDPRNMGAVQWAARDPIFWLHHCNIDRLWASWNIGGRSNPNDATFLNATFAFADENGQQVVGRVRDVVSMVGSVVIFNNINRKMLYEYSEYEKVPPCNRTFSRQIFEKPMRVLAAATPVALASDPVRVQLKTPEALGTAAPETTFDMRIRKLASGTRVYLVISRLQAAAPPNALYDLYFAAPEDAMEKPPVKHRVGTINFFNASIGDSEHAQALANADKRFFSFDVTSLVRRLEREGRLRSEPAVTIIPIPVGEPTIDAKPVIGSIEVILQ